MTEIEVRLNGEPLTTMMAHEAATASIEGMLYANPTVREAMQNRIIRKLELIPIYDEQRTVINIVTTDLEV